MDPLEQELDAAEAAEQVPAGPASTRRPGRGGRIRPEDGEEVRLRDGSRIWVRPIRPDDRQRLVQGMTWLSERSRYLRFHTSLERLTSSQLDYLVDVDHHDHDALVAIDPDAEGRPGVAVARYIRLAGSPQIAEAAITVIDEYQGLGIGTTLIAKLERLAHGRGIRTFRNYVLPENEAMIEIFRQLGGEVVSEAPGLYRVDVPVPGPEDDQPDTPAGRWVASVGRSRESEAESWAFPLAWAVRKIAGAVDSVPLESRLLKLLPERRGDHGGAVEGGAVEGGAVEGGADEDGA